MHKKLYLVSGSLGRNPRGGLRAGRHNWFGPNMFGAHRGFANFIETRDLRHANAQYRRLKVINRQMDCRQNRKAVVIKYDAQR